MNILESVAVEGFWGTQNFTINFHPDVNFLIGVNGSGKTTLINMIAASLMADLEMLDRLPFTKLRINLLDVNGRRKPSIEIEKKPGTEMPFPRVSFRIRDQASGPGKVYSLDDFEQNLSLRSFRERETRALRRRRSVTIVDHLRRLTNVSWLSIHRSQGLFRSAEDRSFESTVDRKLDQISTELIKYFSLLTRRSEAEVAKFQETVFLSLIEEPITLFASLKTMDLEGERQGLTQIFQKFGITEAQVTDKLTRHFNLVASALDAMEKRTGYSTQQFGALVSMARIHSLIQEWHSLGKRQDDINEPREEFLKILNRMMARKTYRVNEKNELISVSESNALLPLTELSSGEKQLLIILAEALLQQKAPWIYIADEPELSLHVNWQEQLINNLRLMNPRAQIVFATHSPDIVSSYGTRVFDMQQVLGEVPA